MPTKEKKDKVEVLREKLEKAATLLVADYKGLNVDEVTELRKQFRENNVEYIVAKNTLISKALEDLDFPDMSETLKGPTAIAISYEDVVAPYKVAKKFIDDLPKDRKFFEVKSGVLEGRLLSKDEIKTLAELPSREELLTRLVRALQSPVAGFVNVCAGPLRNFVNVLSAIKDAKEA